MKSPLLTPFMSKTVMIPLSIFLKFLFLRNSFKKKKLTKTDKQYTTFKKQTTPFMAPLGTYCFRDKYGYNPLNNINLYSVSCKNLRRICQLEQKLGHIKHCVYRQMHDIIQLQIFCPGYTCTMK